MENKTDETKIITGYSGGIVSDFLGGINMELVNEVHKVNLQDRRTSISEIRTELTKVVNMIYKQTDQITFQQYMGVERKLPKEALHMAKGFFITDFEYNKIVFPTILRDPGYGLANENGTPTFSGRFIYPMQGFNGEVLGLIGYDKDAEITKYLLSRTRGFGKNNMFFGMHLMRWIYSMGYIVVVEGIVEAIYLWTKGIPAISLNGNTLTPFVIRILKRFGHNVIFIPDNDETGSRAIKYWKKEIPEASVITLLVGKDVDDFRLLYNEQELFTAIETIKKSALIKMPIEVKLKGEKLG